MKKIYPLIFALVISSKILFGQQVIHACCDTFVCLPGTMVPLSVTIDSGLQGTLLINADDIYSQVVNIGFSFTFFGNTYTQCVLSTNGYINFNLFNALQYSQWPISNSAPSASNPLNSIYGPWHDIDPAVPPYGTMGFGSFGTAPNRFFVFNFCGCPMYSCNDTLFTGQIILYETSNNIEIHLTEKRLCSTWNGGAAIEGLQDNTGTVAVVVPGRNYPTQWTAFNDAYQFTPSGATYTVSSIPYAPVPFVAGTPTWTTLNGNFVGSGYNITVNPMQTTSYIVSTASCGFSADTITIVVGSVPATYDTTDLSCIGSNDGAVAATPTDNAGPYTFVWTDSNGDTLQLHSNVYTDMLSDLAPGTYELWFINSLGCDQVHEYVVTEPQYNAAFGVAPVSICNGTATLFTDSSTGNISSYLWSFGDGSTSTLQNPGHTYTTPGGYLITLVITTPNGCTDTAQASYIAAGTIQASVDQISDAKCFNSCDGFITVSGSGGALPFSYSWSNGATSPGITNLCAGAYTVIVSDSANCADTLSLQINQPTQLYFTLDSIRDPSCYGYFDGYIKAHAFGGSPNYSYTWTPYGGNSPAASHLNENTYTIEVKDSHGCLHDTTMKIFQPSELVIAYPGDTTICYGTQAKLNVPITGGTPPYSVSWSTGDATNPLFFNSDFDSAINVIARDAHACIAGPVEYRVQVLHKPVVNLGNDTILCDGDVLNKSVFTAGALYEWQDGSKYYDYEITKTGTYWVNAFNSCFSTPDSIDVKFDDCSTCVHVPDAFTPNDDGLNDVFKPVVGCYFTDYIFKVFNRWGQLMFYSDDPDQGWDGRNAGKSEEVGTYIWELQYAGSEHSISLDQKISGYVVLIR